MSIYIKGVDMPTNCTDCCYRPLVGCNPYQDNGLSPSNHRHRTCPITEVAEPHGRLIDANELVRKWYETNDIDENDRGARFVGYSEIVRMIDNAQTVIERSEG